MTLVRPREQSVIIQDVDWNMYSRLLDEMGHGATRMVYDNGVLEIMTTSPKHELVKTVAARVLEYMATEFDWPIDGLGNVTLRRRDLQIGLEPDECYYISTPSPEPVEGELDLLTNPPPDLAIEVEVTKSSVPKVSIYAQIGVREIWRWTGDRFVVLERNAEGKYDEQPKSALLPALDLALLAEFTLLALRDGQPAAMKSLRQRLGKA